MVRNSYLSILLTRRMMVAALMGVSSGLPLLLTGSVLQAWMTDRGVDLGTVGLISLIGLPYTLKFLWAPVLDRWIPPVWGRRRGWILMAQISLIAALVVLAFSDPVEKILIFGLSALAVSFFSATQDIVIDAYRRESLADQELGLGSSMYVNGYRVGMLFASGGGLILADWLTFSEVYLIMAFAMFIGVLPTYFANEPPLPKALPQTLLAASIEPIKELFRRENVWWLLAFILLYKVGDTMASHLSVPFYLSLGYSKSEIGTVVKLFGFWATIAGGLAGGFILLKVGVLKGLLYFGVLQGLSTAGFVVLAELGYNLPFLALIITFENVTAGMGTAAFVAFMASMADRRFTATQYALLSGVMGIPRTLITAPTGYLVQQIGWSSFFLCCTLLAIPGLLILRRLKQECTTA